MPYYINHFTCNPNSWPAERQEHIAAWKAMIADANQLVDDDSPVKFTGWINNTEGYVLLEADSKADVIRLCARFWPLFHNDIMEIVPEAEAGAAIMAGVTEGWENN